MDISLSTPQDFPRTAIVTGSDSGIGRVTAVVLAEMGCDVGITWHTDEYGAQATAEEVRAADRRARVRHLDLTILPDAANAPDELADLLGGVDVLVNNAGTGTAMPSLDIDYGTWEGARHRCGWRFPVPAQVQSLPTPPSRPPLLREVKSARCYGEGVRYAGE